MRKKILISAYAISPYKGSEFASAWNTVTNLAKIHDVWVLYGISDDHMGDTKSIHQYVINNPNPAIKFIEVEGGTCATTINLLNKAGAGWFFYFAYYLWQKKAFQAAKQILKSVNIDVVHQLGPIGFREPGFLWQLNKPVVWGPVGGMMQVDARLLKGKPLLSRIKFQIKNLINTFQLGYSLRVRHAFERADVLIAATKDSQSIINERFGKDSIHLAETWLSPAPVLDDSKFRNIAAGVKLVWSGTHNDRKNLELCLRALARLKNKNWLLQVLGSGPLTESLKRLADTLNISHHIIWCGQLNRLAALKVMQASHLHIITSIAEDNPNVLYEALSNGIPTITLDHFGMADVICNGTNGIKISIDENEIMAGRMADIIDNFLTAPELLVELAKTTLLSSRQFCAEKRVAKFNSIYDEAILRHQLCSKDTVTPNTLPG